MASANPKKSGDNKVVSMNKLRSDLKDALLDNDPDPNGYADDDPADLSSDELFFADEIDDIGNDLPDEKLPDEDSPAPKRKTFFDKLYAYYLGTQDEHISAFAGQSAFFIFLSFFPIVSILLTLSNILPFSQSEILGVLFRFIPGNFQGAIEGIINDIYSNTNSSIVIISVIMALWSAAKGFMSLRNGLNEVYRSRDKRNYVVVRSISMAYTAIFIILIISMAVVNIFGEEIADWLVTNYPNSEQVTFFIYSFRNIASILIMFVFILFLYTFVPNKRMSILRQVSGAMIASTAWLLISKVFSRFFSYYVQYSTVYGSLTTVVLIMTWLYFAMYIIFIGAMWNQFIYENYYTNRKTAKRRYINARRKARDKHSKNQNPQE